MWNLTFDRGRVKKMWITKVDSSTFFLTQQNTHPPPKVDKKLKDMGSKLELGNSDVMLRNQFRKQTKNTAKNLHLNYRALTQVNLFKLL